MYVLGITGDAPTDSRNQAVDRVADRLGQAGRVGVVRYDATIADGAASRPERHGGDVTYELGADGDWAATGTGLSVRDALDGLASDCDYAIVDGVDRLAQPQVVIGGPARGVNDPLAIVEHPRDLDLETIVDALHERESYETLASLVETVTNASEADRAGAIATFTGRVRARDGPDDVRTKHLEFEKYDGFADEQLVAIESDLARRDGVLAVELHHRTGIVPAGEDIVFVVVLAGHRREAFRTVEDGINRLKDEVPLFKKEVTVDDEFWAHERR
ncbi:bifunctional molybdopterin-guanine dinucleotide biosynthesis protein MobB/MoaE [Halovivax asiaticus JCM 14624]|uniref:Bifunctional molybdopterin-guanine dinucleotide biosynthesis protein MobB/MoaE n=1 Tax=Halovivax asiaticus JCM 14624 TaxID=1227490 RepID=M0BKU1_9EURY|nr:molybdopterin synthase [Halovivax asiaticus]ELZ11082.1 bifunctional molybdopterin-guanine dinucleotide biosynthesis protein MobB/MoaE [Halovivax asiaticus JCM 14624]